jgi:hypothetical protein
MTAITIDRSIIGVFYDVRRMSGNRVNIIKGITVALLNSIFRKGQLYFGPD